MRQVRKLGPVDVDSYDSLKEVIKLMMGVLELNLFENSELIGHEEEDDTSSDPLSPHFLPPHLFVKDSLKEFWQGICMLVFHLDVGTICRKFMSSSGHRTLLNTAVNTLKYSIEGEGMMFFRVWCGVVWCGEMRCSVANAVGCSGVVGCGLLGCGMVWCGVVGRGMV